jgi:glycosyltransferase involved in cell wall biosynthesis
MDWQPDVIHAHQLFPTGDAAVQLGSLLHRPVIATAHGSDVHTYPLRSAEVASRTRYVIESADRITTVSHDLTSQIAYLGNPVVPGLTVHLGVDTDRFRPQANRGALRAQLDLPAQALGLISVCRLSRAKGVFDIVESFDAVLEKHPTAWLVFLGDGPAREELEKHVASRGLQGSVYFPGARPNEQVADWLSAADVFVLASHAEGLPNIVLEAMACGLPVVASDVGGTGEALADGFGVLFGPGDVPSLTRGLLKLADAPELRERLGSKARDRVKVRFSWDRVARTYLALYSDMLSA